MWDLDTEEKPDPWRADSYLFGVWNLLTGKEAEGYARLEEWVTHNSDYMKDRLKEFPNACNDSRDAMALMLVRDRKEGRGGKVLLQSEVDRERYEALAEIYFNKYPNLIHDKNAAYIWADLEIKGLVQHMNNGIVSIGFNGMSYNDNADY